jgi:SMI1 / KNR4 family (SUKH-1)
MSGFGSRLRSLTVTTHPDATGFDDLLSRMAKSSIADINDLKGCTAQEIATLETRYGLTLPNSYHRYLALMGHRSGRLFTCDHMAVFYSYVIELTDDFNTCPNLRAPSNFRLPPDAFIIAARLGAAWQFIRCSNSDDSPVWYFDENEWIIKETDCSVLDWLNTWCGIAEDAIAQGYFDVYPSGTTP